MACARFSCLPAAVPVVFLTLCAALALICIAAAGAPTPSASSAPQQYRDRRVAQLRAALLGDALHRIETLPDPPLALGVHTACIKFGRGCPDAYIWFLEELLTSLRSQYVDGGGRSAIGGEAVEKGGTENAKPQAQAPWDDDAATRAPPTLEAPDPCVSGLGDCAADAAVSLLSHDLRLPLQLSWSYEARKHLENLLHLLTAREAELRRDGVSLTWLQRLYHVPFAEHIHLVEDLEGTMTARLHRACAVGSLSSALLPEGLAEQKWEDVYGLWCRYAAQQYQAGRNGDFSAANMTAAAPSSLVPLPRKAWHCHALHHATLFLKLLVHADGLLTWALRWTFYVAVPSSLVVCVVVWLCVGDAWTEAAEAFVLDASVITSNAADQGNVRMKEGNEGSEGRSTRLDTTPREQRRPSTATELLSTPTAGFPACGAEAAPPASPASPVASVALAEGLYGAAAAPYDAATASEDYQLQRQRQRQRQQRRRAALLRCRFVESSLHRSSTLFFLKLRLLLCLLVAGQLLWSLWRVLAASYDMTASAAPLLQFFLPSWLLACLSAYFVVPLQMVVLATALKGALSAHEELLSFQAKCAAEQRTLLNAAGLLSLSV
ncbi:hypothetical protein CUR178_04185 [Leishmania enriettii]|uniref:Uncharacterized protein n=1 Tax=Leishmania enriettii TaxID=5663 RepID=A0A836GI17_LEIEN|nr:hypothetical protein CUR178_04185 [Leishmania enriettii]